MATPRRGEVWLIDFGMPGKTRPALVVSGAFGDQDRALITVIPHTTSLRGSPSHLRYLTPFHPPLLSTPHRAMVEYHVFSCVRGASWRRFR